MRIGGGTGAATVEVSRITLVRKRFRPVQEDNPRHYAYWRRELLAYASDLLPTGPGLAAPHCFAITEDAVYLEDVQGPAESPSVAAQRLGAWQAAPPPVPPLPPLPPPLAPAADVPGLAGDHLAQHQLAQHQLAQHRLAQRAPWLAGHQLAQRIPWLAGHQLAQRAPWLAGHQLAQRVPWLAGHQLAQRVAAKDLDWTGIDVDARLRRCWERRDELLARLEEATFVLSHGDFHIGHLTATASDVTTVVDWAGLGMSPLGADLAHLALSTLTDGRLLDDYLRGLGGTEAEVAPGYAVTLGLTAASRYHWMRTRGVRVPDGYVDFVLGQLDRAARTFKAVAG
ncbi:MAG TPA: hypothetical protein VF062_05255 [Candidatus Limnocylindrales bacterium]